MTVIACERYSIEALLKRVQSGDSRALTELGKRLLVVEGVKPAADEGIALLHEAVSRGEEEAAALLAVGRCFNADVLLSLVRDRISAAAGAPVTHFEVAKLLSYAPGEQFGLHADFIEPNTPELVR